MSLCIKQNDQTSFRGLFGYDGYGTQQARNQIAHQVKLTPRKVDSIVDTNWTTDIGINKSLDLLTQDTVEFNNMVQGLATVHTDFGATAKNRAAQLVKKNPPWSMVPYIGIVTTAFRGDFMDDIRHESRQVVDDWNEIYKNYDKHVNGQKQVLFDSLDQLNRDLSNGTYSTKSASLPAISKMKTTSQEYWDIDDQKYFKPTNKFIKNYVGNIEEAVNNRQDRRLVCKTAFALVGGDLIPGLDTVADFFGDSFAELFIGVSDDLSNMINYDIRGKMDEVYSSMPNSIKPHVEGVNNFAGNFFNFDQGDILSQEKFESTFQSFISDFKSSEVAANINEFGNSVNIHHLDDFIREGGNRIFLSSTVGSTNTLMRNYQETGEVSIKGIGKDIAFQTIANPLLISTENFLGDGVHKVADVYIPERINEIKNWKENHIPDSFKHIKMPERYLAASKSIIDKFEGQFSNETIRNAIDFIDDKSEKSLEVIKANAKKEIDHFKVKSPAYATNLFHSTSNNIFNDIVVGKTVDEKEINQALKGMETYFFQFSEQVNNLSDIEVKRILNGKKYNDPKSTVNKLKNIFRNIR